METTERFKKAYDALVTAFFEGTLAKGDCACCAVGSIISGNLNAKSTHSSLPLYLLPNNKLVNVPWGYYSSNSGEITMQSEIVTGYNLQEQGIIERAFESNTWIDISFYKTHTEQEILEDQYKGLCAVVDVLMELDNITPDESYKNKFREHPVLAN